MSLFDYGTWWVEKCLVHNKQCKMFLSVSNLAQNTFIQEYTNVNPEKIHVIQPGVDVRRFEKVDRHLYRQEIRKQFGIDDGEIL